MSNMRLTWHSESKERDLELAQNKESVRRLRDSMGEYEKMVNQLRGEKDKMRRQMEELREEKNRLEAESISSSRMKESHQGQVDLRGDEEYRRKEQQEQRRQEERIAALLYELTELKGVN